MIGGDGQDLVSGGGDPDDAASRPCCRSTPRGALATSASGNGIDMLSGDAGDDHIYGADGNDKLFGGSATLNGRDTGDDLLGGGDRATTPSPGATGTTAPRRDPTNAALPETTC